MALTHGTARHGTARVAAIALATGALLLPVVAHAGELSPSDLQEYGQPAFAEKLQEMGEAVGLGGAGLSVPTADALATVKEFTEEFAQGNSQAPAVTHNGTWITPLLQGEEPVGTALVWHDEDGTLDIAEVTDNRELAAALVARSSGDLVLDAPASAWFSLSGDELLTLSAPEGQGSYSLAEYAAVLRDRNDAAGNYDPADPQAGGGGQVGGDSSGPAVGWLLGATLAVVAAGGALLVKTRRSRHADQRGPETRLV